MAEARYQVTYPSKQFTAVMAHPSSMFREVMAWTLFAGGRADDAVALLRPLADEQDKVGKGEVELPAREMIGDMLRLSGRPAEALAEYRLSLSTDPGRFDTLLSTGETAQTLGVSQEAVQDYRTLLRNAAHPSSEAAKASLETFPEPGAGSPG